MFSKRRTVTRVEETWKAWSERLRRIRHDRIEDEAGLTMEVGSRRTPMIDPSHCISRWSNEGQTHHRETGWSEWETWIGCKIDERQRAESRYEMVAIDKPVKWRSWC